MQTLSLPDESLQRGQFDIEAAFMDYTDVMDVLEKIIVNTYAYVSEKMRHRVEIARCANADSKGTI